MDQASGACPVSYFGRCDGRLSALDAVQPIAMLIVTLIEMNLVGTDDALENFGVAGNQRLESHSRLTSWISGRDHLVASDKDPSLTAVELDAIGEVTADV